MSAVHLSFTFPNGTVARAKKSRPRAVAESVIPKEVLAKEVAKILDDQELTQNRSRVHHA
jgi:hypothetical protein